MDNKAVIVNQPAADGEISRATKSIEPIAKIVIGALSFIGIIFAGSKTWIQIEANTQVSKELKEQITRQYSTHKQEIDQIRKDYDKEIEDMKKDQDQELDVLEVEIEKLKEQVNWHLAYEAALKDIKK